MARFEAAGVKSFEGGPHKKMRRNQSSRPSSSRAFCTRTCYNCHATGHLMKNCPSPRACFNCGSTGHLMKDCSKPRAEGARDFLGSRGKRHGRRGRGTSAGDSSRSFDSSETGGIVYTLEEMNFRWGMLEWIARNPSAQRDSCMVHLRLLRKWNDTDVKD